MFGADEVRPNNALPVFVGGPNMEPGWLVGGADVPKPPAPNDDVFTPNDAPAGAGAVGPNIPVVC